MAHTISRLAQAHADHIRQLLKECGITDCTVIDRVGYEGGTARCALWSVTGKVPDLTVFWDRYHQDIREGRIDRSCLRPFELQCIDRNLRWTL